MLRRYQVLLPDWLGDYVKYLVEKYDLSFSEIIRTQICLAILSSSAQLFPEYEAGLSIQEITKLMKEDAQKNMERNEVHSMLSKIYFETRKIIEYRLAREKETKKK